MRRPQGHLPVERQRVPSHLQPEEGARAMQRSFSKMVVVYSGIFVYSVVRRFVYSFISRSLYSDMSISVYSFTDIFVISLETPAPLRYTGFSDNVFTTKLLSCLMLRMRSRFCRIGLSFLFVESSAMNGVAILHR